LINQPNIKLSVPMTLTVFTKLISVNFSFERIALINTRCCMTTHHLPQLRDIPNASKKHSLIAAAIKMTILALCTPFVLSACGDDAPTTPSTKATDTSAAKVDINLFSLNALAKQPEIVDCTLENGDKAQCAKLILKYQPDEMNIGPFCPPTLEDEGGIWDWDGTEAGLYRLDKSFLTMLNEQGYTFYDDDGKVHIVDNATSKPTVDHACINVTADESVKMTVLIPTQPKFADEDTSLGTVSKVGVALAGVPIFSDAPSVLDTGHLPALDTCAGHIDPGGWYHYHATSSDMNTVYKHEHVDAQCNNLKQDPAALFGYAFDGFPIYGSVDANNVVPADLDECSGHTGPVGDSGITAYHYHATEEFPNLPKCFKGVVAKNNFSTTAAAGIGAISSHGGHRSSDAGAPPGQDNMLPPGFDKAAEKLGITSEVLMQAMGDAGGPQADLAEVADTLGISESELKAVLPKQPSH
jgi:hypothetical protein